MKKLVSLLLTVCICLSVGALLVACNDEDTPHEHEIATEWSFDDYYHYHEASCNSVNHRSDVALHEGDKCFCGYDKNALPGPSNTDGDDAFSSFTLSKSGVLKFNRIKGASKYVLTLTPSGSASSVSVDVSLNKTEINLDSLIEGGFSTGKTTVQFQAWEYDEVEIDGETISEEVPMTGVKETFRVIKLNDRFELQPLTYKDEQITLDGFYSQSEGETTEYVYEFTLSDNKPTKFNVSKSISAASGTLIKIYKTAEARENNDSSKAYGEFDLSTVSVNHGKNYFYVRAVAADGSVKDYDLCVYGLYTVEVTRYQLTTTSTDSYGVRTVSEQKIGENLTVTERDIITYSSLYDGVSEGLIARDDRYNIIYREDYMLSVAYSPKLSIYFYDETTVASDCAEFSIYAESHGATAVGNNITMSVSSDFTDEVLSIPYVIAGKAVGSVGVYFNNSIQKIYVAEGFASLPVSLINCNSITDVYIPSTISYLKAFAFKDVPRDTTIHCAFSSEYAQRFDWQWNRINGSISNYNTVYDDVSTAPSVDAPTGGLLYELTDRELTVVGSTDGFRGNIPDTAKYNGSAYPVTAIKLLGDCSDIVVKIGKNIESIGGEAFISQVEGIELDPDNKNFVIDKGALYNADKTRLIVTSRAEHVFLPSTLTTIDYYSLYSDAEHIDYSALIFYDLNKESVDLMKRRADGNVRDPFIHREIQIPYQYRQYFNSRYYAHDGVEYVIFGEYSCPDSDAFPCTNRSIAHAMALRVVDSDESLDISVADGVPVLGYFYGYGDGSRFTIPDNVTKLTVNTGLKTLSSSVYSESKIEEITLVGDYDIDLYRMPASSEYLKAYSVKDSTKYAVECGILYNISKTSILDVPSRLEGEVVIPSGVTEVSGFENRKHVTSVKLPSTVTVVTGNAFKGCSSLVTVEFSGTGTVEIRAGAFFACTSLEQVILPKITVSYDNYDAYSIFKYCGSLKSIDFKGTLEEFRTHFGYDEEYDVYSDIAWTWGSYVTTIKCTDGEIEIDHT